MHVNCFPHTRRSFDRSRRFQTDLLQSWIGLSALVQVRQGSTNLRIGSDVVLHLRNEVFGQEDWSEVYLDVVDVLLCCDGGGQLDLAKQTC